MSARDTVLKELSSTLNDQKLLSREKESLEKRIITVLNSLGVKGASYSEVVIKISGVRDKYAAAFIKVEDLIKRRDVISQELVEIDSTVKFVSETMKDSKQLEYEVFTLHYFDGLTLQEIANKKNFSLARIKQISSDISKKFFCQ